MNENHATTSTQRGNQMAVWVIIIVVLVGLGFFVLSKRTVAPSPQVVPNQEVSPPQETTPADAMQKGSTEVREIKVSGENFAFDKKEIRVKKGETVRIVLTSTEGMHDWVIDEFNAKTQVISVGQTSEAEFTPNKTGTFEYYCNVGNHRAMGMVGKLIVE